jgi:hypothetical protein
MIITTTTNKIPRGIAIPRTIERLIPEEVLVKPLET